MKKVIALGVLVCLFSWSAAVAQVPYVSGQSTATLITEPGPRYLWYLYEIAVDWDLNGEGAGMSHLDVILKDGCKSADHLIEFDVPAGLSTSVQLPDDPEAMGWTGYFERNGDPSLNPVTNPVIKYNNPYYPPEAEPGPDGTGTFWFYANIIPEYGSYEGMLVGKAGTISDTYGDLVGAYPSCTIIPEPAAMLLLGVGAATLLGKRKR